MSARRDAPGSAAPTRVVGLLALQGDFEAHARALTELGAETRTVTRPEHLEPVDSLILPGGESTAMVKLIEAYSLGPALAQFHRSGRPLFGTCAGLILLSSQITGYPGQLRLGLVDATVERNAYGRQIESFETAIADHSLGGGPLPAVFIRAPRVSRVGPGVEVLARLEGECVLIRQGSVLAATFHPELTADRRVHRLFLDMGRPRVERRAA